MAVRVCRTGGTITAAGLILAGTFTVLAIAGNNPQARQLGYTIAFAVILDTFFVRTLLVPRRRRPARPIQLVAVHPVAYPGHRHTDRLHGRRRGPCHPHGREGTGAHMSRPDLPGPDRAVTPRPLPDQDHPGVGANERLTALAGGTNGCRPWAAWMSDPQMPATRTRIRTGLDRVPGWRYAGPRRRREPW